MLIVFSKYLFRFLTLFLIEILFFTKK